MSGCLVSNLFIKGVSCSKWYKLGSVLTHPNLPDTRNEMAIREVVASHPHISHHANKFPMNVSSAQVMILVGADCGELMETKTFGAHYPFVHKTPLGYSLVGPACVLPGGSSSPDLKVLRTSVDTSLSDSISAQRLFTPKVLSVDSKMKSPFEVSPDDDLPGYSQEDTNKFLKLMEERVTLNEKGNIQLPLPIREGARFPENKSAVYCRTKNTIERLARSSDKLDACIATFQSYLDSGHVVQVNNQQDVSKEVCYIPIFPVYNEDKAKVRFVFDFSASFDGLSLNQALMRGPDCNNSLIGVLLRFRLGEVAIQSDIEKMFHAFFVEPQHTDLLRFFWFSNNNPSEPIVVVPSSYLWK